MEPEGGIALPQGDCQAALEVGAESAGPHLSSIALMMLVMVWMVFSAKPPRVSATRGTKSVPEVATLWLTLSVYV